MFRNTEIYDLKNTNNIKTRIPIKNRIKLNFQNKLVRISNFSSAFSSEVNITMDLPNAIYGILVFILLVFLRSYISVFLNISNSNMIIYFASFIALSLAGLLPAAYLQGLL